MSKLASYMREIQNGFIHFSHLESWRYCPRQFKLNFLEGQDRARNIVMEIGSQFHRFTQLWHNSINIYEFEEFSKLNELIAWQLSMIPDSCVPLLKMYIERFLVFECRRYWYYCRLLARADEEFIPYKTEFDIRAKMGRWGKAGTIDALFVTTDDEGNLYLKIRDYKVARKMNLSKYRGQLTFYKMILQDIELFPNATYRFEVYNPLLDNGVFPLETGTFERTRQGIHTPYFFLERPMKITETYLIKAFYNFVEALESGYFPKMRRDNINKCLRCSYYGNCWGRY